MSDKPLAARGESALNPNMAIVRVLVAFAFLALAAGCAEKASPDGTLVDEPESQVFQLRLVDDAASPNSEQMTLFSKSASDSPQEVVYVQKNVLLKDADVVKVSLWVRRDIVGIDITLTDAASERFAELTRHNIGRRAAVVIDGRLRSAPHIRSEISVGTFDVTSNWGVEEARLLAKKIESASKNRQPRIIH